MRSSKSRMHGALQETNFGSLHDLQAINQQTSRPHASTAHPSQQLSPSSLPPPAFASPPPTTREDINALGLDSPDSFLDHLHRSSARPPSSLQAITSRCRSIIGQLADPLASTAGARRQAGLATLPCEGPSCSARHASSGAVLASSQDGARSALDSLPAEGTQQQAVPGKLSRFAEAPTAPAQAAGDSPARQVVQQLQSFLASRKHVIVGGYEVASQTGQLLKPATAYKPMKALKSVLGPRLQAGNVTRLDVGLLLQEAGWPPHLHPSPILIPPPISSLGGAAFPLQPLSAAASMQRPAAPLLGTHLSGCMLPPAPVAATGSCALTGNTASPLLAGTFAAQQQQKSGEQHAPGGQPPPNTPEQVQSCLASLGLTGAQIQACLENAQRIEACL